MELEDFVARSETVDKKIAALTERCTQLEQALQNTSNTKQPAYSILDDLHNIRTAIINESKQLSDVQLQNTKLTEENQRLQYRIEHIMRSMDEIKTKKT